MTHWNLVTQTKCRFIFLSVNGKWTVWVWLVIYFLGKVSSISFSFENACLVLQQPFQSIFVYFCYELKLNWPLYLNHQTFDNYFHPNIIFWFLKKDFAFHWLLLMCFSIFSWLFCCFTYIFIFIKLVNTVILNPSIGLVEIDQNYCTQLLINSPSWVMSHNNITMTVINHDKGNFEATKCFCAMNTWYFSLDFRILSHSYIFISHLSSTCSITNIISWRT